MVRLRQSIDLLIVVAGLLVSTACWSTYSVPAGYRAIARERAIPHTILYAVALAESGKQARSADEYRPWPWTLNVAGEGHFYATRIEAWQALRIWLEQGRRSIDIGLMQVNWRYHRERLGTLWQALDPYHNLRVGAAILQECYSNSRDWWVSVGCYHAPANPQRAGKYRRRVQSRWLRLVREG
jgi:hypothetical protein